MSIEQTTQKVLELVAALVGPDQAHAVSLDSRLLYDGTIDSFGLVSLLGEIETAFSISFSAEDLTAQNFQTVNDMVLLVERYLNAESASD